MSSTYTRYKSLLDWSTWLIVGIAELVCLFPLLLDDDSVMYVVIISVAVIFLIFMIIMFKGTYYEIDGNSLVIYEFFRPTILPIDKIESVLPTKSFLAAPATSIVKRLAIRFTDRKILKSSMPLIISPENQDRFIAQLLSINPQIIINHKD